MTAIRDMIPFHHAGEALRCQADPVTIRL